MDAVKVCDVVRGMEHGGSDICGKGCVYGGVDVRRYIELTLYDENERKAFIFIDAIQGIFEEYDKDRETPYTSVMIGGTPCWVKESIKEIFERIDKGCGAV